MLETKVDLTSENYYTQEQNLVYMSNSQFKDFMKCEVEGLAKAKGMVASEKTPALLFGGYVDAYFSNELEQFKVDNPEMFKKDGELKSEFKNIEEVIGAIENDSVLMRYLSGEKQVIMTGEINGVPYKIKIDSYFPNQCIVDQKIIKDLDLQWFEKNGKNIKTDFVEIYGYDIQGAIYQEIVRQNTGLTLPFILAITTKQENPEKVLLQIDQYYLDQALQKVKDLSPRYDMIKKGLIEPCGCGHCASCRKDKKVSQIFMYSDFFKKEKDDE